MSKPLANPATPQLSGGAFLFTEVGSRPIVTPESFSEEQRAYFQTALKFMKEQVLPKAEQIEKKDNALLRDLLRQAGELGLLMLDIQEQYGGLATDKTTSMLVAEANSWMGSWSVTFGAHVGIGSLPIVWFGTAEQKQKYLPKLATGEWIAAYALTEPGSGSDALGAKTTAKKSADGKQWVLNGSKLFITNSAFADVFVVFAKVDGEKFTGFIVERNTPGFTVGPEEHKMGIRGSSTCPLYFEDAKIPVENVLGEIGKGHKIAFNILNLGRLKLGVAVLGGMKKTIDETLAFTQQRKQFQTPIFQFPLIREKFARMVSLTYALESMAYRTAGLIDEKLAGEDKTAADYDAKTIAAIEEYAIEASVMKVFGSEALGTVIDEGVQCHGGVGYIEEYPIERAYRDARINRIFEGTNEINRMLISGMLLKRTMKGALPLFELAQTVEEELVNQALPRARGTDELEKQALSAEYLKRMAIYSLKVAVEAFGPQIEEHQEILAAVADVVMDAFALDSMVARTRQAAKDGKLDPARVAATRLFAAEAQARSLDRARKALCASVTGDVLEKHLSRVALLGQFVPYDPAALRETIVTRLEESGAYPFS
jgi:alkylation response protein AidB-like acyl-CoA dehydrogenase